MGTGGSRRVRRARRFEISRRSVLSGALIVLFVAAIVGVWLPGGHSTPALGGQLADTGGTAFISSIDTMKLSKDQASGGFTEQDGQAVDLAASMAATHISVDTQMEYPSVLGAWSARIHRDGKQVWFRLASTTCNQPHGDLGDGYPSYQPGYLTELHTLMLAHPEYFAAGDILDGDAEAENSCWWANHYGCGVQGRCDACNQSATNMPCAPIPQFINFLAAMTQQESIDLAAMGIAGVLTTVHSTDPDTATRILTPDFVQAMGDLITVDAYPDQNTTSPSAATDAWLGSLTAWHQAWLNRGTDVSILVGEWGYSNALNVDDATQESVIRAEVTQAFPTIPYLVGTNYWVGPGVAGDGGDTQIFSLDASGWQLRPAAADVSTFYANMASRSTPLPGTTTSGTPTTSSATPTTSPGTSNSTGMSTSTFSTAPGVVALRSLVVSPRAFRAAYSGPTVGPSRLGAAVRYSQSSAATVTFSVLRITAGVRRGRVCSAVPRPPAKGPKRCLRLAEVGRFRRVDGAGVNRFHFTGRLHDRRLTPGAYILRAWADDTGGALGAPFRVLKP